jgi:hypothetical protein
LTAALDGGEWPAPSSDPIAAITVTTVANLEEVTEWEFTNIKYNVKVKFSS